MVTIFIALLTIIFPVLACALTGYIWAKRSLPFCTDTIGRLVMNVGAPALIISSLTSVTLSKHILAVMSLATIAVAVLTGVITFLCLRLSRLDIRTYFNSGVFVNTGNLGLPLCYLAFGDAGMAYGLIFFMVLSVLHFSLGLALVSQEGVIKSFITNPIIVSVWIALLCIVSGWEIPTFLAQTLNLLGGFAIPLMLIALGVSLASMRVVDIRFSIIFSCARVFGGALIGYFVALMFALDKIQTGVVIIQSAMPVAVFNYLLAVRYNRNPEHVAALVVCSTALLFICLPMLLYFII